MSPKLLRRMQSSAAYRVNVCMVIYPAGSQNLHPRLAYIPRVMAVARVIQQPHEVSARGI